MSTSIESIQEKVWELASIVGAPKSITTIFSSSPQDGRPHVKIQNNEFTLVHEEHGYVFSKKTTQDLNLLLYWIFRSVTSQMAQEFELKHRNERQDSRRIMFSKQLELMKKISVDWHSCLTGEIERILLENPYIDSDHPT